MLSALRSLFGSEDRKGRPQVVTYVEKNGKRLDFAKPVTMQRALALWDERYSVEDAAPVSDPREDSDPG